MELDTLSKRARAKWVNNRYLYDLIDLDSPLKQSYWNTYHCASILEQKDGKLTGKYCGNRWCHVCNRIRTAKAIRGYTPHIETFENPWFVTLTVPNARKGLLDATLAKMGSTYRHIYKNAIKRRKMAFRGIRKVECTYNPLRDDYHPHFHFLIDGEAASWLLYSNWILAYPQASPAAQDLRPATTGSVFELFKYHTKIFVDRKIYPHALDHIFQTFRGHRVFQPFGIKAVSEDVDDVTATLDASEDYRLWHWLENDWLDQDTGELLTGWEPSAVLEELASRSMYSNAQDLAVV